jgi:hypothetical protein
MILPAEYVRDCCQPGDPAGAQIAQMKREAPALGWDIVKIQEAEDLIISRATTGDVFPFPRRVRYV